MAHAYTPGLKVTEKTRLRKERRLPLKGEIRVKTGALVKAEEVVARAELPGNIRLVNAVNKLGVLPGDINEVMLKKEGDRVREGEIIGQTKGFFGLFKSVCRSPVEGSIENISTLTGQVLIRENPIPVEVNAYVNGQVVEVFEAEGVTVATTATFIQGIFGLGGERIGELKMVSGSAEEVLTEREIDEGCRGKIIIGGSLVTHQALKKASEWGVKGIIVGGLDDQDLREFLGYDIGVAITGGEDIGLTLVITEGFGKIRMAATTFDLLKGKEGMKASINGATQIRAGVMRPEVVIPLKEEIKDRKTKYGEGELTVGTPIRVIREPYFGRLGKVTALPVSLQMLETEAKVRVVEVELASGEKVTLPRANIEIIEV